MLWNRYFGRWRNQAGFLWRFVDTDYSGAHDASGPFWPVSTEIVSNNLAIGAEQLRNKYFFVSDKVDRYFVSSPLEWGFEVFVEEDIWKQGVGRLDN